MKEVYWHLIIILGAVLSVLCASWFFSFLCLRCDPLHKTVKKSNDTALKRAYHRFYVLYKSAILWTIAEYILVILPFISNAVVIYLTNTTGESMNVAVILLHSIISLSLIVFSFAINPQRQKKCYRKAFRCLDSSINEYLSLLNTSTPNSAILNKGIKDAEDFIDSSYDIE